MNSLPTARNQCTLPGTLLLGLLMAAMSLSVQAQLPDSITRIKPSIVMVGAHSAAGAPAFNLLGSGFAVGGNLIATNAHVSAQIHSAPLNARLVVRLIDKHNEQLRNASVVGSDPVHDLALLRIDGPPIPATEIGNSSLVREGEAIAFIGFPIGGALGFSPVTHRGIVSAITSIAPPSQNDQGLTAQRVRAIRSGAFPVFQLDATAYPGNSGGPVFKPDTGQIIGIINMVFVKGAKESALSQPSGITYAIPAEHLKTLMRSLDAADGTPTTSMK